MTALIAAWDAVHEALPACWCVGRPSYDPGVVWSDGYRGAWSVAGRGPHPGRGKMPQTVTGTGQDETAALRELVDRLGGVPKRDGNRMDELRRRLGMAYIDGAEEWSQRERKRGLTAKELSGLIERFPTRMGGYRG
jgi:hypothetical protein